MCKKVEKVTANTGCTSCTKQTISFEVSGFHTETRLLQRDFISLNLFELQIFVYSKCTIENHIINFQPFLTLFVIFHAFTDFFELNDPEIEKHYKWNLKRLKVQMMIPCELSTFSEFIWNAFQFQGLIAQNNQ